MSVTAWPQALLRIEAAATQAGGVLAAQEMLTQREHTLHLAKASAASVLQLLEHQKHRGERFSSAQELALS